MSPSSWWRLQISNAANLKDNACEGKYSLYGLLESPLKRTPRSLGQFNNDDDKTYEAIQA